MEELIVGKDKVVRGAKIRVITKGKPIRMSRPIQKLYPLEIRCVSDSTKKSGVGITEECKSEPAVNEVKVSGRNVPEEQQRLHLKRERERWLTCNQVKGGECYEIQIIRVNIIKK